MFDPWWFCICKTFETLLDICSELQNWEVNIFGVCTRWAILTGGHLCIWYLVIIIIYGADDWNNSSVVVRWNDSFSVWMLSIRPLTDREPDSSVMALSQMDKCAHNCNIHKPTGLGTQAPWSWSQRCTDVPGCLRRLCRGTEFHLHGPETPQLCWQFGGEQEQPTPDQCAKH